MIDRHFVLSVAATGIFYTYLRTRESEHTASTPHDLAATAADLARATGDGVLVLPMMYADFVMFAAGKKVLWGGHSGDLSRFEAIHPVIRQPLEELIERYDIHDALLDLAYIDPEQLRLTDRLTPIARHGSFTLYKTARAEAGHADGRTGTMTR